MKAVSYKGYNARIEFDAKDKVFVGRLLRVNDVVGFHGESMEGLREAFHEAVDDYLETRTAIGKPAEKDLRRLL